MRPYGIHTFNIFKYRNFERQKMRLRLRVLPRHGVTRVRAIGQREATIIT